MLLLLLSPGIPSPTLAPSDRVVPMHAHPHGPAVTSFGGGGGGYILGGGSGSSSGGGGSDSSSGGGSSSSSGTSASTATGTNNSIPQDRSPIQPSTSVPPPLPEWMPEELCEKALELYAQHAAAISSKCFLQTKMDGKKTKDPFQGAWSCTLIFPANSLSQFQFKFLHLTVLLSSL